MRAKLLIFKSSPWFKRAVLLTSWFLSFLTLIIIYENNEFNAHYNYAASCRFEFRVPKNELGAISYIRRDPEQNCRPIYSISFRDLYLESGKLGIFKTGLHKVAKIRDLEIKFYEYSGPTANIRIPTEDLTADARRLISKITGKLITPRYTCWVNKNLDVSNISEVQVNDFACKVFHDGNLFLSIQSKRAITSYKQTGLVLRGHVIIKTADGSTLESNHVRWDTKQQRFAVKGVYVLNRKGVEKTGRDICVDAQLNHVKTQNAKVERKENQKCFAKL